METNTGIDYDQVLADINRTKRSEMDGSKDDCWDMSHIAEQKVR